MRSSSMRPTSWRMTPSPPLRTTAPPVRCDLAGDDAQQRRLPDAVGPHERDARAVRDPQVDAVEQGAPVGQVIRDVAEVEVSHPVMVPDVGRAVTRFARARPEGSAPAAPRRPPSPPRRSPRPPRSPSRRPAARRGRRPGRPAGLRSARPLARALPAAVPVPVGAPPDDPAPPSCFARKASAIGASAGSTFASRSLPVPVESASCATTACSFCPNTCPTILRPSSVSTSSRSTPPSTSAGSCCARASPSDAAPAGSCALARSPPSSAGSAAPTARCAVASSTPSRPASWSSGTVDRMSSMPAMGSSSGSGVLQRVRTGARCGPTVVPAGRPRRHSRPGLRPSP